MGQPAVCWGGWLSRIVARIVEGVTVSCVLADLQPCNHAGPTGNAERCRPHRSAAAAGLVQCVRVL